VVIDENSAIESENETEEEIEIANTAELEELLNFANV
jgi:hypothetical protein